jgi:hypothetical protein
MHIVIPVKIKDSILLRADESNYELCRLKRHTDKTTGEIVEEWVPERYFATLGQALYRVLEYKIRASEVSSLQASRQTGLYSAGGKHPQRSGQVSK